MINTMFASNLGDGPIFWLQIAFRLMQLPLGIFGVAIATVTLPVLSRSVAEGKPVEFRANLARGLRLAFLLTIPSTIGLYLLAEPIISVLYQHGRFGADQTAQAAAALKCYAVGLCAYSAMKVLVPAFYALDRRKTPMMVSFISIGVNVLMNWILTFHFKMGHRGLALSTGFVALTNFAILYWLMRRETSLLETRALLRLFARLALPCALLGGICKASMHWLLAAWATMPLIPKMVWLGLTIGLAGAVFFVSAAFFRIEEV